MSKLEVSILKGSRQIGLPATNEDATALAEHLESGFVIIPKADLPSVKRSEHDENSYRVDGESVVYTSLENARMWCMRDIAVWQFIESEGSRRRELMEELGSQFKFSELATDHPLALAIDRIIELENKA
jgi:hypothetical protein